jgi:hypothetical protein
MSWLLTPLISLQPLCRIISQGRFSPEAFARVIVASPLPLTPIAKLLPLVNDGASSAKLSLRGS